MRKPVFIPLIIILFQTLTPAGAAKDIPAELTKMLETQKEAWNSKNLEGFMSMYWRSPELTFQSGPRRVRGWKSLFELYHKNYSGSQGGILDFTDLEVTVMSPDAAYILGRWKVTTSEKVSEGVFTLIFRRFPEGWRIIHDHSS